MNDPPVARRGLAISDTGFVTVRTDPVPSPGPGEILVRTRASLISAGTELGPYRDRSRAPSPPESCRPFGYQCAGEVIAAGDGASRWDAGQRVACMGANYALHADFALVPVNLSVPLPDDVSAEEGAFCALAATAMHAVRRGETVFGEEVVVTGLGIVGQLVARVCRIAGARVFAHDPLPFRVEFACRAGIEASADLEALSARVTDATGGLGLDAAYLCFGGEATETLRWLAGMMRMAPDTHRMGAIVIVGGARISPSFGADLGNLDLRSAARTGPGYHDPVYERGAGYPHPFVRWTTQAHLRLFVRWIAEGRLCVSDLITDRIPLAAAPDLCAALMDRPDEHLGAIVTYEDG